MLPGLADCGVLWERRGSQFLRRWMDFLEENADLRYPDVAVLAEDDA